MQSQVAPVLEGQKIYNFIFKKKSAIKLMQTAISTEARKGSPRINQLYGHLQI